jgi:hypothetical protein
MESQEITWRKRGREVVFDPDVIDEQQPRKSPSALSMISNGPPSPSAVAKMADNVANNPQVSIVDLHKLMASYAMTLANPFRWLSLKEAAAYSGLSEGYLRRAAAAGLPSIVDRERKVRRDVLDSIDGQVELPKARKRKRGAKKAKGRK